MAQYNKTLGRFSLNGIAPARRGVPQIEVTFDIDANGIVHVSAKDLGTGNAQDITITASGNLSDEDIEKAVQEAEKFAEEDKKNKEAVEIRNNADQLIYQTESMLEQVGDKIDAGEKADVEADIAALRSALESNDNTRIKDATDALQKRLYAMSEKMYQQAGGQPGGFDPNQAGGFNPNGGADGPIDADFESVDDEE